MEKIWDVTEVWYLEEITVEIDKKNSLIEKKAKGNEGNS